MWLKFTYTIAMASILSRKYNTLIGGCLRGGHPTLFKWIAFSVHPFIGPAFGGLWGLRCQVSPKLQWHHQCDDQLVSPQLANWRKTMCWQNLQQKMVIDRLTGRLPRQLRSQIPCPSSWVVTSHDVHRPICFDDPTTTSNHLCLPKNEGLFPRLRNMTTKQGH